MFSYKTPVVFFEAEGAAAGGANPQSETPPSNPTPKPADVENIVQRTIQSVMDSKRVSGDTSAALEVLAAKALKEEARAKAAEAKLGIIPDDVKVLLDAYKALGTTEDLTKRLETATTLEVEKVQRELSDGFRKAAAIAGYDADAVMEVIGTVPESVIEKSSLNGKDTEAAKVKVLLDGKEELMPFDDFMKSRFVKTHDSLKSVTQPRIVAPVMGINGGIDQSRPIQKPAVYRM